MRRAIPDGAALARTDRTARSCETTLGKIDLGLCRPAVRSTDTSGKGGAAMRRRRNELTRLRCRRVLMCYRHDRAFMARGSSGVSPTALHPVAAEVLPAFDDEWIEPAKVVQNLDGVDPESLRAGDRGVGRQRAGAEARRRRGGPGRAHTGQRVSLCHYCTQDEHCTGIDSTAQRLHRAALDRAERDLAHGVIGNNRFARLAV